MGQRVLLVSRRSLYIMVQYEWHRFRTAYPHADFKKFSAGPQSIEFEHDGIAVDVFREDITPDGPFPTAVHHYGDAKLNAALLKALGPRDLKDRPQAKAPGGFPKALELTKATYAIGMEKPAEFDVDAMVIYVAPEEKFTMRPRRIFTEVVLKHTTAAEAHRWLRGADMSYWPQQLSFALWCATAGCGVGVEMHYEARVDSLLKFHVLFTTRRILSQMSVPLPGDGYFHPLENKYDKSAYNRICREFQISPDSDFRLKGENGGLGRIYKKIFGRMHDVTEAYDAKMDGKNVYQWPGGFFHFNDESGSWGDHELDHISPLEKKPYLYFALRKSKGLTKAGLARLNQSIEAFVYTVLGAQVNTRSSIVGDAGSATETRAVFLKLFEDAIKEADISKSIQRYQMAVQSAKVRLDFAIAPGCWLMPSHLILNAGSVAGYNNRLQRATADMKMGVNEVNVDTKQPVPHFDKPPKKKPPPKKEVPTKKKPIKPLPTIKEEYDHDLLKGGITAAAVGLGYFMLR